jgi:hypothetical protein
MAGWPCGQRARPKREVLPTERPTRRGNGTNGARGRPWGQFFGRSSTESPELHRRPRNPSWVRRFPQSRWTAGAPVTGLMSADEEALRALSVVLAAKRMNDD